jgi:hypothetical protein
MPPRRESRFIHGQAGARDRKPAKIHAEAPARDATVENGKFS